MIDRMAPPENDPLHSQRALSITDLASCVYRPERCIALRGASGRHGRAVTSAAPRLAPSIALLDATADFLRSLGLTVETEPDPMLQY